MVVTAVGRCAAVITERVGFEPTRCRCAAVCEVLLHSLVSTGGLVLGVLEQRGGKLEDDFRRWVHDGGGCVGGCGCVGPSSNGIPFLLKKLYTCKI